MELHRVIEGFVSSCQTREEKPMSPPDPVSCEERFASLSLAPLRAIIASWMGRWLRVHCSADDVMQETLCMAWRDRRQYRWRGPGSFEGWVLQIARNRIRDLVSGLLVAESACAPRRLAGTGTCDDTRVLHLLAPTPTPSEQVMAAERSRLLTTALALLPIEVRDVVRLRACDGMTFAAIAHRLCIGPRAVQYRFQQGRARFVRCLRRLDAAWSRDG